VGLRQAVGDAPVRRQRGNPVLLRLAVLGDADEQGAGAAGHLREQHLDVIWRQLSPFPRLAGTPYLVAPAGFNLAALVGEGVTTRPVSRLDLLKATREGDETGRVAPTPPGRSGDVPGAFLTRQTPPA